MVFVLEKRPSLREHLEGENIGADHLRRRPQSILLQQPLIHLVLLAGALLVHDSVSMLAGDLVTLALHFFFDQGDGRLQVHDVGFEDDAFSVVFGNAFPDVLHVAGITGGVEAIASTASLQFLFGFGFDAVGLDLAILDLLVHLQGLEGLV
jgi:hypothetical protein